MSSAVHWPAEPTSSSGVSVMVIACLTAPSLSSTAVESRHLGESGLVVSAVGLGGNNLGRPGTAAESLAGSTALVAAALEAGITLFDVADVYGAPRGRSEELLGAALSGRRDQAVIATKFGVDMQGTNGPDFGARGSRRYVKQA